MITKLIKIICALSVIAVLFVSCERSNSETTNRWSTHGIIKDANGKPLEHILIYATNGVNIHERIPPKDEPRTILVDETQYCSWSYEFVAWKDIIDEPFLSNDYLYEKTSTDANGWFKATLKLPISGLVIIWHPDYLTQTINIDLKSMPNNGNTIDIGEITMQKGASVSGTVFDYDDKPIPSAGVALCEDEKMYYDPTYGKTAKTDHQGKFIISGLADGKYKIAAWLNDSSPYENKVELKQASSPAIINFKLPELRDVKIQARNRRTGLPLPGCKVILNPSQIILGISEPLLWWSQELCPTRTTNQDGIAIFKDLQKGKCIAEVSPPDEVLQFQSVRHFDDENNLIIDIDMPMPVKIKLIDDATSQPIRYFNLLSTPVTETFSAEYRRNYNNVGSDDVDSPNGEYTIKKLRAGKWKLDIHAHQYYKKEGFIIELPETGLKGTIIIPMARAAGKARGILINSVTEKPIEGLKVWIDRQLILTKADGSFSANNLFGEGNELRVFIEGKGYVETTIPITNTENKPLDLGTIRIDQCCIFRGKMIDINNKPFRTKIRLLSSAEPELKCAEYQTIPNNDGTFEINNLPVGDYNIDWIGDRQDISFTKPGTVIETTLVYKH